MDAALYNYRLEINQGEPSRHIDTHHFQTLPQALQRLLTHSMEHADHVSLAEAGHHQTVAAIYPSTGKEPLVLLEAIAFTNANGPTAKAGLQIVHPGGTLHDLEEMAGIELFKFQHYNSHRNYLWIAAYEKENGVAVSLDGQLFAVQDELASQIGHGSDYQLTIKQQFFTQPSQPLGQTNLHFYYENGLWALWALTQHEFLSGSDPRPFLEEIIPAHLTIQGPGNQVLAESRLIAPNSPGGHLYQEHGLLLQFTEGLTGYLTTHGPSIDPDPVLQVDSDRVLLLKLTKDSQHLQHTPIFETLQYQVNRAITEQMAPPYGGYYIERGYLPTRIPVDNPTDHPLLVERDFVDTFRQGLEHLQTLAPAVAERNGAIGAMEHRYLVQAVLREDGKELARLFKSPAGHDLPAGLYLKVNPDQVTLNALSKLGPFLSDVRQTMPFHFLLTQPGTEPPGRKHGGQGRTLLPGAGSQRAL